MAKSVSLFVRIEPDVKEQPAPFPRSSSITLFRLRRRRHISAQLNTKLENDYADMQADCP